MTDTDSGGSTPEAPEQPAKTSRAGRDLPAAIAVSLLLGGTIIAILLFAPRLWVALVAVGVPVATGMCRGPSQASIQMKSLHWDEDEDEDDDD